jgi:hypothetical protein
MGLNRYRRRVAAWIACFAVMMASLAPSISQALASRTLESLSQEKICSLTHSQASGTNIDPHASHGSHQTSDAAKVDNAPHSGHSPQKGMHFEHCPFCFTHAGSFGLLPAVATNLPAVTGSPVLPLLFFQSPRPLFTWISAQPRAPPVVS